MSLRTSTKSPISHRICLYIEVFFVLMLAVLVFQPLGALWEQSYDLDKRRKAIAAEIDELLTEVDQLVKEGKLDWDVRVAIRKCLAKQGQNRLLLDAYGTTSLSLAFCMPVAFLVTVALIYLRTFRRPQAAALAGGIAARPDDA